jgi:hypothetical protein
MHNGGVGRFLVAALALAAAGCDKMPLLAPTNSSVTVTASALVLPLGGSAEVSAFVAESGGTPVQNGTVVRFTATLGRVDPVEVQTRNGRASTTFYAGDVSGIADVRATSGSAGAASTGGTTGATASNLVQIAVGAAAVDSITIRSNPSTVSTSGGTVDLVATVMAVGGRALGGITVVFSATAGSLTAGTAVTDASGEARTRLTTIATSEVTATAAGKSAKVTVTAQPGPSVSLTCSVTGASNCTAATLGQAVTFTAQRGATTSLIRSATLDFGDGSSLDLGTLASPVTVSHAYSVVGSYTARLTATDVNGESTVVVQPVQVLAPVSVSVTAVVTPAGSKTVVATATVAGATAVQYEWTFEGTVANIVTTTNSATYTYATGGSKTVSVRVVLSDGRTVSGSASVSVPL